MRSYLWSEGKNVVVDTWWVRTYALPVFSSSAMRRWRDTNALSGAVWDRRNMQGQALRLLRVHTIMQMEVSQELHGLPLPHIRLGEHHLSLGNGAFFVKILALDTHR